MKIRVDSLDLNPEHQRLGNGRFYAKKGSKASALGIRWGPLL